MKFLGSILRASSKLRMEVPMYEGSLNVEELVNWISDLDMYFKYKNVNEDKRVKFIVTRLKCHASL